MEMFWKGLTLAFMSAIVVKRSAKLTREAVETVRFVSLMGIGLVLTSKTTAELVHQRV